MGHLSLFLVISFNETNLSKYLNLIFSEVSILKIQFCFHFADLHMNAQSFITKVNWNCYFTEQQPFQCRFLQTYLKSTKDTCIRVCSVKIIQNINLKIINCAINHCQSSKWLTIYTSNAVILEVVNNLIILFVLLNELLKSGETKPLN